VSRFFKYPRRDGRLPRPGALLTRQNEPCYKGDKDAWSYPRIPWSNNIHIGPRFFTRGQASHRGL